MPVRWIDDEAAPIIADVIPGVKKKKKKTRTVDDTRGRGQGGRGLGSVTGGKKVSTKRRNFFGFSPLFSGVPRNSDFSVHRPLILADEEPVQQRHSSEEPRRRASAPRRDRKQVGFGGTSSVGS
ncbi:hypothetical protein H6P81_007590 [Aristolochia fimbriata]|uniref:Uncharacterized protein n=1 Tax=Aristolochia fimbriata TaxID=158543 RepID=A0AAV7F1X9_ARIFI|nr:hypothetical protein H6P81_007590 [Aristolochia fimbriata]